MALTGGLSSSQVVNRSSMIPGSSKLFYYRKSIWDVRRSWEGFYCSFGSSDVAGGVHKLWSLYKLFSTCIRLSQCCKKVSYNRNKKLVWLQHATTAHQMLIIHLVFSEKEGGYFAKDLLRLLLLGIVEYVTRKFSG